MPEANKSEAIQYLLNFFYQFYVQCTYTEKNRKIQNGKFEIRQYHVFHNLLKGIVE